MRHQGGTNVRAVQRYRLVAGRAVRGRRGGRAAYFLQTLESRLLLAGNILYVNDNWHIVTDTGTPGLSAGDIVDNSGPGDDGALHDLIVGTHAFGTLAGALAAATPADRVVFVSGNYTQSAAITMGLSLEGWPIFAASAALPAANPDPAHLTQASLNAGLDAQLLDVQWTLSAPAGQSLDIRGLTFLGIPNTGAVRSLAANQAPLTMVGNVFSDTDATGVAVQIDAGAAALPVALQGNVFTSVYTAIEADSISGSISLNTSILSTRAFVIRHAENLTIISNTISDLQTDFSIPGIGILADQSGAGLVITLNHLSLDPFRVGILLSNTGVNTADISENVVDSATPRGLTGILITNNGATFGYSSGPTHALIRDNQLSALEYGIGLDGLGASPVTGDIHGNVMHHITNGVFLQGQAQSNVHDNLIYHTGTGINVQPVATALIANNSIQDSSIGIHYDSASAGTITATRFDTGLPNLTDINVANGDLLTFGGGDRFAATFLFFDNESSTDFTLAGEDFGTTNAATINARIRDQLDDPGRGLVSWVLPGEVVGQHLFYKDSAFDVGSHDAAIADKTPLLPGATATFDNYSNYHRGINGLMIDLSGTLSGLTAADFSFATGNDDTPDDWTPLAAVPTLTIRPGAGDAGSTRIELTFADHAIENTWLKVTVHRGPHTDLVDPVTLYFGSAVGEAGNAPDSARVDAIDALTIRAGTTSTATLANPLDINRDGAVNGTDEDLARTHATFFLNELRLITLPGVVLPAFAAMTTSVPMAVATGPVPTVASLYTLTGSTIPVISVVAAPPVYVISTAPVLSIAASNPGKSAIDARPTPAKSRNAPVTKLRPAASSRQDEPAKNQSRPQRVNRQSRLSNLHASKTPIDAQASPTVDQPKLSAHRRG